MNKSSIPTTDSIEELAQFWDSHDLTKFEQGLEEVAEPVFQRGTVVHIPLDPKQAAAVEQIAAAKGITLPALIQQWIHEQVAN